MKHIITFIIIVCFFLIFEFQNELKSLFSDYSYLIVNLSYFAVIMTSIIRAKQILSLIANINANIKAKFSNVKKIEDKICKNDEIDAIQNLAISNLEIRIQNIEKIVYEKNM